MEATKETDNMALSNEHRNKWVQVEIVGMNTKDPAEKNQGWVNLALVDDTGAAAKDKEKMHAVCFAFDDRDGLLAKSETQWNELVAATIGGPAIEYGKETFEAVVASKALKGKRIAAIVRVRPEPASFAPLNAVEQPKAVSEMLKDPAYVAARDERVKELAKQSTAKKKTTKASWLKPKAAEKYLFEALGIAPDVDGEAGRLYSSASLDAIAAKLKVTL